MRTIAVSWKKSRPHTKRFEQEFLKAPPSHPSCTPHALTRYRARRQASNSRYSSTIPSCIFLQGTKNQSSSTFRGPLMSWADGSVPSSSQGSRTPYSLIKEASKRFFDIAESHPNAHLRSAASCDPPQPDSLTAALESLIEVNDTNN
ncbi:hypothetical protein EVAR_53138_1 [Eumeta japonica]|uniref:Uncharacterized protein n=1 Tax=Eumeta variegata TaxID=151549 RepID=A0A4C1YDB6_EUMVA|nr:hypothetical protein EVAR_53138_1 [Eumeta japonica]